MRDASVFHMFYIACPSPSIRLLVVEIKNQKRNENTPTRT